MTGLRHHSKREAHGSAVTPEQPTGWGRAGRRGDKWGVEVGGEPGGELGGGDGAGRLDLAGVAGGGGGAGGGMAGGGKLLAAPAAGDRDGEEGELGGEQGRGQQDQQRSRVGADEEGEAVALEPAPLVLAGAELVVVVDHGGRLDPERAAAQAQPQREVDILVVEEEPAREAADLVPGPQRDRQAGAREDLDLAGGRRRGDRLAVAPGPDDPDEMDRIAVGVDPGPPRVGEQRLPGRPPPPPPPRHPGWP